jgi:hypothetical protein
MSNKQYNTLGQSLPWCIPDFRILDVINILNINLIPIRETRWHH